MKTKAFVNTDGNQVLTVSGNDVTFREPRGKDLKALDGYLTRLESPGNLDTVYFLAELLTDGVLTSEKLDDASATEVMEVAKLVTSFSCFQSGT